MLNDIRWIASEGGPLMLLPVSKADQWLGCFGPLDPDNPEEVLWPSDYDRLGDDCEGLLDLFELDGPEALVFADEPLLTTTWPADSHLRYFVQVAYSNGLYEVIHSLQVENFPTEWEALVQFEVIDSEMVLFDAALQGQNAIECGIFLRMPLGLYSLEYCDYTPDPHTKLIIYRMRPA